MMDDIFKFRAWDTRHGFMVQHVTPRFNGDVMVYEDDVLAGNPQIVRDIPRYGLPSASDLILMQCTGLRDKNRRLIYVGDITSLIVDSEERRFVVSIKTVERKVFSHPGFLEEISKVAITGFVFDYCGYQLFPCITEGGTPDNERMTVIGNIHENPELLEAQDNQ